ncbi:MAG: glycosyltransferase family 9 protein [Chloroflexi bacterium]|nr:glycosyltransferase family 9 protein [Chloroflexota bacterium]
MEEERAFAHDYLVQHGVGGDDILVTIHPGAGAAVKLWPAERYAQVADALAQEKSARVIITGSRDELGLAWSVAAAMRSDPIVAAGRTTLGQLAALFARCHLVIGSDSGPLHLAVAVGAPTLHLYGPVDPKLFGPWSPGAEPWHRVIVSPMHCVPCNKLDYAAEELTAHPCMSYIPVEEVLQAARDLLGNKK